MAAKRTTRSVARNTRSKTPRRPGSNKGSRMALMSDLLGRARLVQRMAGIQYGGARDIYGTAGYVPQGETTYAHFWAQYTRGDIGGRIVDMPAKTTWRQPPEVVEEGHPAGTAFTKAYAEMAERLKLYQYLTRIDQLAGVGRYAVLFLGVRGSEDRQLKEPLEKVRKPEDVIYLSPYSEEHAEITEWVTNPGDPRFGLPQAYKLTLSTDTKKFSNSSLTVHASRCLHIAEHVLEDEVYGRPRLERPLNRLFDLDKIAASTGEAYWQTVTRILQAKVDAEADISDDDLKVLDEKLGEMIHDLRRQFSGQGVELSWLGTETPDVSTVADFYFSLVSGACGIPKRILFGSEMGQLASSQDQANYLGMIGERQQQFAEPSILRQFIDRMIAIKALPAPKTGKYQVVWPVLFEEPEKDVAETNRLRAEAAKALTPVGGDPALLVEIDEQRNIQLIPRKAGTPSVVPEGAPDAEDEPEPGAGDGGDGSEDRQDGGAGADAGEGQGGESNGGGQED